jgi:hypothetical protein
VDAPPTRRRRARAAAEDGARRHGAALFLAAIRELGKDGGRSRSSASQQFMRVEEHFQALLLYDQLDFLRQPLASSESERDFALNIQRICLEAANGFQRYLRNAQPVGETREALDTMFRVTGLACTRSTLREVGLLPRRARPHRAVEAAARALRLLAKPTATRRSRSCCTRRSPASSPRCSRSTCAP